MPCDYSKYPEDWQEIRKRTLDFARNHCEECHVKNGAVIVRSEDGTCWYDPDTDYYYRYPSGERIEGRFEADLREKSIKIVLTISHTDHDTTNNDPANLRALCQQCHNRHDVEYRKANRAVTLKSKKAAGTLFDLAEVR
jgi:5-methylcytosine-specific restriction endonuclease McrA